FYLLLIRFSILYLGLILNFTSTPYIDTQASVGSVRGVEETDPGPYFCPAAGIFGGSRCAAA
ncbi:hypothetical protein, partial [Klebsiella pneumoniae]|uniref:hypothetical protein n=1 Tax=Klebsiella pneumoniae TaxID=573 RepID=UPI001C52FCDA